MVYELNSYKYPINWLSMQLQYFVILQKSFVSVHYTQPCKR